MAAVDAPKKPVTLTTLEGFTAGALGACMAVTVTNPMEVAKTRMQLDGELQSSRPSAAAGAGAAPGTAPTAGASGRVYKNVFDCMAKTAKFEGIRGVQRGLGAAYFYQVALNGSRLGFFEPIRQTLNSALGYESLSVHASTSIAAGATSGMIGGALGNSLFLVKARMQSYSPYNPVGAQHHYTSIYDGFRKIIAAEGPKGLLRGIDAAILRTAMGSSVQLPSYILAKKTLNGWGMKDGILVYLASSTFAGMCVLIMMQPADTVLTRLYSQAPNSIGPDGKPRGLLYKGPIDCLMKTYKAEGVLGWYKGSFAHLLRIAPHTIVTLTANEMISRQFLAWKTAAAAARAD
ncbi:oxaloacetate carrier [Pseudohyphozyma bogoriensis]|nr:oxaloacetate carrier [Pseudohyphozyma bogoriensis]